jgi:hypothetical protein
MIAGRKIMAEYVNELNTSYDVPLSDSICIVQHQVHSLIGNDLSLISDDKYKTDIIDGIADGANPYLHKKELKEKGITKETLKKRLKEISEED